MHCQIPTPLQSTGFDCLTLAENSLKVLANPKRHMLRCLCSLGALIAFASVCTWGMPNAGLIGQLLANLSGILAALAMLAAARSLAWWLLELPTLQLEGSTLTVYLAGSQPIALDQKEIATVILSSGTGDKLSVALEPVSPEEIRRSLSFFDRCCYDSYQKLVGFGFSYKIVLPTEQQAELIRALRKQFGSRVISKAPEFEAFPSEA